MAKKNETTIGRHFLIRRFSGHFFWAVEKKLKTVGWSPAPKKL